MPAHEDRQFQSQGAATHADADRVPSSSRVSLGSTSTLDLGVDAHADTTPTPRARSEFERLARIVDLAHEAIVSVDDTGRITFFNRSASEMFGYEPQAALGQPLDILLPQRFRSRHRVLLAAVGGAAPFTRRMGERGVIFGRRANGEEFPALASISSFVAEDGLVLTAIVRDVTEQYRQTEALRWSEQLNRAVLDAMEAQTIILDNSGRIISVNRAWRGGGLVRSASDPPNVGDDYLARLDSPAGGSPHRYRIAALIRSVLNGEVARGEFTYQVSGPGSETSWFDLRVEAIASPVRGAVVSHLDVTQRKQAELSLLREALHDPLTRLPNRLLVEDRITHALRRASWSGRYVGVVLVDIDGFSAVNECFGHDVGDAILIETGRRLNRAITRQSTVGRIDGDAFVVLFEDLDDADEVQRHAASTRAIFEAPFHVSGHVVHLSASVGLTVAGGGDDPRTILSKADAAMHRAKATGRSRIVTYEEHQDRAQRLPIAVEHELRRALLADELRLYLQPQYDLENGRLHGAEALVRWTHPEWGPMRPDEFVSIAEESDLIADLDAWVLDTACRTLKALLGRRTGTTPRGVSVNVSSRHLLDPGFPATVSRVLEARRIEPDRLTLELTETAIVHDPRSLVPVLSDLAGIGVRIALDDFGTGFSSLSHLRTLPVDELKIDRTFVAGLDERDSRAHATIRSILAMAAEFGVGVVAEGIETEQQLDALRGLGCAQGQGFLLGPPVEASRFRRAVARSPARRLLGRSGR